MLEIVPAAGPAKTMRNGFCKASRQGSSVAAQSATALELLHNARLLHAPASHAGLVAEFDRLSEVYDGYVRPFSTPIFAEALALLSPLLPADARVLDAGTGKIMVPPRPGVADYDDPVLAHNKRLIVRESGTPQRIVLQVDGKETASLEVSWHQANPYVIFPVPKEVAN